MKFPKMIIAASSAAIILITIAAIWIFKSDFEPKLKQKIHLLKAETIPLRFKIISKQDGKMLIAAKFFNLDGMDAGRFETNYKDGEIKFHYVKINIEGRNIFLPEEMETSTGKIALEKYYFKDDFPQTYTSRLIDTVLKKELEYMFKILKKEKTEVFEKYYGQISYGSVSLTFPWERTTYGLKTDINGEISLISD